MFQCFKNNLLNQKFAPVWANCLKKKKKGMSEQHGMYLHWQFCSKVWKLHNQNQARECFKLRSLLPCVFATSRCQQEQRSNNTWHHFPHSTVCIFSVNGHLRNEECEFALHFFSLLHLQTHRTQPLVMSRAVRQSRTDKIILTGCGKRRAVHEPLVSLKKKTAWNSDWIRLIVDEVL